MNYLNKNWKEKNQLEESLLREAERKVSKQIGEDVNKITDYEKWRDAQDKIHEVKVHLLRAHEERIKLRNEIESNKTIEKNLKKN